MTSQLNKKIFACLFGIFVLTLPVLALADTSSGGGTPNGITYECATTKDANGNIIYGNCTWADVIAAVKNAIDVLTGIALGFSIIVIAYAGFNYMISGDNPGKRTEANKMLRKVAIGIAYIIGAWLIVTLITNGLGVKANTFLG